MNDSAPVMSFGNVDWTPPGSDRPLFTGLTFDIRPGELVVLTSCLGGGKSSALRMAVGLDQPSHGSVTVCGQPPARVRTRVGYAADQGALLANLTLRENLILPLRWQQDLSPADVERRAQKALHLFGVTDIPVTTPAYAPTNIRRLVTLARAMILEPAVLVLDDPTDDFDSESASEIWRHLADIAVDRQVAILATATVPPVLPTARFIHIDATSSPGTRKFSAAQRSVSGVPFRKQ